MFYFGYMQDKERRGKQAPYALLFEDLCIFFPFSMQIPNGNTWLGNIFVVVILERVRVTYLQWEDVFFINF